MKEEGIRLLPAHPAVVADQLLQGGDGPVGEHAAVHHQIAGVREVHHPPHLPGPQVHIAVGRQRIVAGHLAGVQVAAATLAQDHRRTVIVVPGHDADRLVVHQGIDHAGIGRLQLG